jgi:hypothetical protein
MLPMSGSSGSLDRTVSIPGRRNPLIGPSRPLPEDPLPRAVVALLRTRDTGKERQAALEELERTARAEGLL